jgi:uncharacterized protein YuzE
MSMTPPAEQRSVRRREGTLAFEYDREADILYISNRPAYAGQETEELGDDVVARLNPETGAVEGLEVLFLSTRLLRNSAFELPIVANLRRL